MKRRKNILARIQKFGVTTSTNKASTPLVDFRHGVAGRITTKHRIASRIANTRGKALLIALGVLSLATVSLVWSVSANTKDRVVSALSPALTPPPAIITVNSTDDVVDPNDGKCTLREAISSANTNLASGPAAGECSAGNVLGETIQFSVTGTITLTNGELLINEPHEILRIDGPGASVLTVQRDNAAPAFRILEIRNSSVVNLSGLTISNGNVIGTGFPGGGAIYNDRSSLSVGDCVFNQNSAVFGGAIHNAATFDRANLEIFNSTFSQNSVCTDSSACRGGAISNNADETVVLLPGQTVNSSSAASNDSSAEVLIFGSTFSQNSAREGGAFANVGSGNVTGAEADVLFLNSTFSQNSATEGGGALANRTFGGGHAVGVITNDTFSENSSLGNQGGALFNFTEGAPGNAFLIIGNTILRKGAAPGANIFNTGEVDSRGFNTADDSAGGGAGSGPGGYLNHTGDNRNTDPRLSSLGDNGGPTQTLLPLPDSPVFNTGSNNIIDQSAIPLFTDQRGTGFPRIVNGIVDRGAVEVNYTVTAIAGTPQSTVIGSSFSAALKALVKESGNPQSGLIVQFDAPQSGPSGTFPGGVSTARITTDASGVATAPQLTANGIVGSYAILAGPSPLIPPAVFDLSNDPIILLSPQLRFGQQPTNTVAGETISPPVSVQTLDPIGQPINSTAPIHLHATPINFAGGDVTVNAVNGTATFSDLVINNSASDIHLVATSGGFLTALSDSFNVSCDGTVVTNNNDSGPGSLRDVINNACPGSTITFAPGLVGPINLTTGEILINKNVTINGPGVDLLTVQRSTADDTPEFRIFQVTVRTTLNVSGLAIANGSDPNGGAIFNDRGTVNITNCLFSHNSASAGGAIHNSGVFGSANLTINNSTFRQNSATSGLGEGGAVYSEGFADVTAAGTANVTVNNSIFIQNTARAGGGLFSVAYNAGGLANLTVSNSTFDQNDCSSGPGKGGSLANVADDGGLATANITNTTLSRNVARVGGAIFNFTRAGTVNLNLVNSTVSQNTGNSIGGGGFNNAIQGGTSTLSLTNSTFNENSSPLGGGVFNYTQSLTSSSVSPGDAILNLGNTILRKGTAEGANLLSDGTVNSRGHNLCDDSGGGDEATGPAGYLNGTGDLRNTDPMLGPLANNGGSTQTHLLLPGSPAIDAGDNDIAVDQNGTPLTNDQRGSEFPRILNGTVDLGAVEVGP